VNLFGVVLHNPAAWIGLAALGAPLLIHLLTRRTPRRIVFPTVRFIRHAQSNLSSVFRVRHWILLLLRTLLLMALLAAFLRPVWHGAAAQSEIESGRRVVVIIVDGSLSMAASRSGGGGPGARARRAARAVLDSLDPGDLCNLIVAAGMPISTFDQPGDNRFHLRQDLESLRPTLERAAPDAALAEALRQIDSIPGFRREIHIVSDFQRTNWQDVSFDLVPASVAIVFESVAEADPQNLAVTDVRAVPGNPVVGEPVEIVCTVANFGQRAARPTLQIALGDEPPLQRPLDLLPGAIVSTSFRLRAGKTGLFEGVASLTASDAGDAGDTALDQLDADNARYFVLPVSDRVEALILTDESPRDPLASHRFLRRALDPFDALGPGRAGSIRCTVRRPDDLTAGDLAKAQLVLVCGSRQWAEPQALLLHDWIARGGSLIQFLASHDDKFNLAALVRLSRAELALPFEPGAQVDLSMRSGYAAIADINDADPMLRGFTRMEDLRRIRFNRFFAAPPAASATILMRFDDGNTALARGGCGLGSVLLCNFVPATDAGDLVKSTLFVPLIHEIAQAMRPHSALFQGTLVGGGCFATVPMPPDGRLPSLFSPAGERLNAVIEPIPSSDAGADQATVVFPRSVANGFYRVRPAAEATAQTTLAVIPVNVDHRESDLNAIELERMRADLGALRDRTLAVNAADPVAMRRLTEGRPVWPWLLMFGMALLLAEQVLTLAWRR
jgi:hypothetical protein